MVGPTAQAACLALHVNAKLRSIPTGPFQNSTTQYCGLIRFLHKSDPPRSGDPDPNWHIVADSPDAWMASLRGVRRAMLVHEPTNDPRLSDRMSSGFVGGGGRWFVCLDRGGAFECWEGWWKVGTPSAAEGRIWHVHYARVVESYEMGQDELAAVTTPVSQVADELRDALRRIESFAREQSQEGFAASFRKAQECLDSADPLSQVFHSDIAPEGVLDLDARRVLAACQAAWVFGGMGSWNDLGFEGETQKTYEALSDELFNSVNRAICAAVNRSAP